MKKTLTTITLAMTIAFGATFANAGIIIESPTPPPCQNNGIIIEAFGIIIEQFGIIIEKSATPCITTDGIIIE